jgi:hypothetical protein
MMKTQLLSIILALAVSNGIFACTTDNEEVNNNETMKIKITVGTTVLTATLLDNSTSRALIAKLPLTVPMQDLYGREMCYRFPDALPADDVKTTGYEVGEIIYWPPGHSLVIMYAQNGERFSMQKIGRIDSSISIFETTGDVNVTFELDNDSDTKVEVVAGDDTDYRIYPNPANDYVQVSGEFEQLTLFNEKGMAVAETKEKTVHLNKLLKGVYFLQIKTKNNDVIIRKIIKN